MEPQPRVFGSRRHRGGNPRPGSRLRRGRCPIRLLLPARTGLPSSAAFALI
jgi:hypothetical protein